MPTLAIAEGRLDDALAIQRIRTDEHPDDPAERLRLCELHLLASQFRNAWDSLRAIRTADPAWPRSRRWYRNLIRAANDRHRGVPPAFPANAPPHARYRLRALRELRRNAPADAHASIDRADLHAPHVIGHVDGREFDGLRDADDRYASVLELFLGKTYVWLPFEAIRRLQLTDATQLLDGAFRPARVLLVDGSEFAAVLPLVYVGSQDGLHRLGRETDHINPDGGPTRCVGAKWMLLGEEELPLGAIRQLDLKSWA